MDRVKIEYINYDENLHKNFPKIRVCKVYSKNRIINVRIMTSNPIFNVNEDIGFDSVGKHILIEFGQWIDSKNGEPITETEFFSLEESESIHYEYVCCNIKIYEEGNYRCCFHNESDNIAHISFIPYDMINFSENDCEDKICNYIS